MNLLNPSLHVRAIFGFFSVLYRQRELTLEMTKREFTERYAGQALGVIWGLFHPVAIILVYIVVFAFIFRDRGAGSTPIYLLAGLVPWMAMAEAPNRGTQVISSNANLVKQVIFPLEILPAKSVMATFVNQLVLIAGVLVYAGFEMGPRWSFCLIPVLLIIQSMQMLGLSMALSTIGVYVRDLKDVIQVFCLVNIYLMPVVFTTELIIGGRQFGWLFYLNPFSYQTLCFQDAIYHGEIKSYWVWAAYFLSSVMTLGIGYRLFTKLRTSIGNVL